MSAAAARFGRVLAALATVSALGGCAFMPHDYPRLNEVRAERASVRGDASVARFAAAELRSADEVLERAIAARDTLGDCAVVDHLAYLARQRLEIARETARMHEALAAARALREPG